MKPLRPLGVDPSFIVVLLLLPALFCLGSAMASFIGGWHTLAGAYRDEETTFRVVDAGKRFRWASLTLGPTFFPTNYGNCLTIAVDDEGIAVAVMSYLLRFMHPPLLLPWSSVESCDLDQPFRIFRRATVRVPILRYPLRFYGRAAPEIYRKWCEIHEMSRTEFS
jgi:hypothetical protein